VELVELLGSMTVLLGEPQVLEVWYPQLGAMVVVVDLLALQILSSQALKTVRLLVLVI
jgi:hypothetical protein